ATRPAVGATIALVPHVVELAERESWSGDVVHTVPSVFDALVDRLAGRLAVRTLVFAGEALPAGLVERVRAQWDDVRVVNAYGQSETFYATTFGVDPGVTPGDGQAVPIGAPLGNMRTYVLRPG